MTVESPQQSIRFGPDDKRQIRTIRYFMRRKGRRRCPPSVSEIVRFALEYAAEAIRADKKGEEAVEPPEIAVEDEFSIEREG